MQKRYIKGGVLDKDPAKMTYRLVVKLYQLFV